MSKVIAKGKKKRQQAEDDAEAVEEFSKKAYVVREGQTAQASKSSISTKEIVNVMADEIEEIYHEFGTSIDRMNAEDKAQTLLLDMRYNLHARVKEVEFDLPYCRRHNG